MENDKVIDIHYLIVDTETRGLLKERFITFEEIDSWPLIKQIAWQVYKNGELLEEVNYFTSSDINDEKTGIIKVMNHLIQHIELYNPILVGHHIDFDKNVIGAELYRNDIYNPLIEQKYICTMEQTVDYCSFPNNKFPKLNELHEIVFGHKFEGAHDALNDVKATARCFFELQKDADFEPVQDSISNYSSYEEYINDLRNNKIKSRYKVSALVELLRLFKNVPNDVSIDEEIEFLNKNYLNLKINNTNYVHNDKLSDFRKSFYLAKEDNLINFFNLKELFDRFIKDEERIGMKQDVGRHLALFMIVNGKPQVKDDMLGIAKEFNSYLYEYELWLISNKNNNENSNEDKNNTTTITLHDILEKIIKDIERSEVSPSYLLGILFSLFVKEIYLIDRPEAIEKELDYLEKILQLMKPKLNDVEKSLYYTFLDNLKEIIPIAHKNRVQQLIDFISKNEGCFIATLCYSSYESDEVVLFRKFRDNYLLKTLVGSAFVNTYYKLSPFIVRKIKNYKIIHKLIRILILEPILFFLRLM